MQSRTDHETVRTCSQTCDFERIAHLVSVAAYAGHALDPEVEGLDGEHGLFKEWHDETSEAAIDV